MLEQLPPLGLGNTEQRLGLSESKSLRKDPEILGKQTLKRAIVCFLLLQEVSGGFASSCIVGRRQLLTVLVSEGYD